MPGHSRWGLGAALIITSVLAIATWNVYWPSVWSILVTLTWIGLLYHLPRPGDSGGEDEL